MASLGEVGAAWVEGLPRLLEELCAAWQVVPERALPGGSASYVVSVRAADGTQRVLKVGTPDAGLADEARLLAAAAGHGYALLHGHDATRNAVLLERLGDSLEHTPLPVEEKVRLLATTLREAWLPVGDPWVLPAPGEDRASVLAALVRSTYDALGGPCPEPVVRAALAAADRRRATHDPGACVVTHGDPHPANLLRVVEPRPGGGTGWVFVDGDGVVAEPAYDLGVAMREWTGSLDAAAAAGRDPAEVLRGWCALAAHLAGTDVEAVWDWALLERVSTGLYVTGFGARTVGRRLLDSAGALV